MVDSCLETDDHCEEEQVSEEADPEVFLKTTLAEVRELEEGNTSETPILTSETLQTVQTVQTQTAQTGTQEATIIENFDTLEEEIPAAKKDEQGQTQTLPEIELNEADQNIKPITNESKSAQTAVKNDSSPLTRPNFDLVGKVKDATETKTKQENKQELPKNDCKKDTFTCPDGSVLERGKENGCQFPDCPECKSDLFSCPGGTILKRDAKNNCEFPECPEKKAVTLEKYKKEILEKAKNKTAQEQIELKANITEARESKETVTEMKVDVKKDFNFASFDAGAVVIESPKTAQDPSAILKPSRNIYMLLDCALEKSFTIQLSEDAVVTAVTIANFEHYSSNFENLTFEGSQMYPANQWTMLSQYTAENSRKEHMIILEKKVHVRYVRINITTHHGNEYYCPVTRIQVFGKKIIEDFKEAFRKTVKESSGVKKAIEDDVLEPVDNPPKVRDYSEPAEDYSIEGQFVKEVMNITMIKPSNEENLQEMDKGVDIEDEHIEEENIFTMLAKRVTNLETNSAINSAYITKTLEVRIQELKSMKDETDLKLRELESKISDAHPEHIADSPEPTTSTQTRKRLEKLEEVLFNETSSVILNSNLENRFQSSLESIELRIERLESNLYYQTVLVFTIILMAAFTCVYRCCRGFCKLLDEGPPPVINQYYHPNYRPIHYKNDGSPRRLYSTSPKLRSPNAAQTLEQDFPEAVGDEVHKTRKKEKKSRTRKRLPTKGDDKHSN